MTSKPACAACKYLRKKCTAGCEFAPYFPSDNMQRFESIHGVFDVTNLRRMLKEIDSRQHDSAIESLVFEAEARLKDPVQGCYGLMQSRVSQLETQLENTRTELAKLITLFPQAIQYVTNPGDIVMTHHNIPQPSLVLADQADTQMIITDPGQQQSPASMAREEQQRQLLSSNSGFLGRFSSPSQVPPSLDMSSFQNLNPDQIINQGEQHFNLPLNTPIEQETQQSYQHSETLI